jgi:hypothetical protein
MTRDDVRRFKAKVNEVYYSLDLPDLGTNGLCYLLREHEGLTTCSYFALDVMGDGSWLGTWGDWTEDRMTMICFLHHMSIEDIYEMVTR